MMQKKNFLYYLKQLGPGMMVTGAFIGTGTLTTSIVAGTNHGYTLLWASVTAAVILTIVLQEMAARLALATGVPLAILIRDKLGLWASLIAVLAIAGGNAIYSVGNEIGVGLAFDGLIPGVPTAVWMFIVTFLYWGLLMIGRYNILEKTMTFLVILMSITLLFDMFYVKPDYGQVAKGLVVPTFEVSDIMLILGLIGTTVVPYNLYLHSAGVIERGWWKKPAENLKLMRIDTIVPIFIGGIVTMAVGVVAAAVLHPLHLSEGLEITGAKEMAVTLQPLLGEAAYTLFRIGLFAAAVSSMPMAALSAAYVVTQSFGWSQDWRSKPFRIVFSLVAWIPFFFAVGVKNPIWTIIFAQSVNGMLLPISAIFIYYLINKKQIVGQFKNNIFTNILGLLAVGLAVYLGVMNVLKALGVV